MISDWLKITTTCDPFQRFLAKLFGRKIDVQSEGCRILAYQWRGVVYVYECHSTYSSKESPK